MVSSYEVWSLLLDSIKTVSSIIQFGITWRIAYLVYKVRDDANNRELHKNIHDIYADFWNDEDLKCVREWVAYDEKYESELKPILRKRLEPQKDNKIIETEEFYKNLEKLDKFCSFLVRYYAFIDRVKNKKDLNLLLQQDWQASFKFEHWIDKIKTKKYLIKYIKKIGNLYINTIKKNKNKKILPKNQKIKKI